MNFTVRRAAAADWPGVARLCGRTGAAGDPVDAEELDAFVAHWILPHRKLRPDWTWVAEADGEIVGYLTGVPDSLAFEKERRRVFDPPPDSRDFFGPEFRRKLWTEHPGQLMLAVAAPRRGRGVGTALLDAFFAELARAGTASAHAICGPAAKPFFEKRGFRTAETVSPAAGIVLSAMTRAAAPR